jgi:GMP synthase (glutamine-hydrolysing)
VYEKGAPTCDPDIFKLNIPILGICYGHQLLVHLLGGKVKSSGTKNTATHKLDQPKCWRPQIHGRRADGLMSHGDEVTQLPPGMEVIAKTEDCNSAAMPTNTESSLVFSFTSK